MSLDPILPYSFQSYQPSPSKIPDAIMDVTHLTVSFPNRDITTSPFSNSSFVIFDGGADLSICPGARMAGLGGPWG